MLWARARRAARDSSGSRRPARAAAPAEEDRVRAERQRGQDVEPGARPPSTYTGRGRRPRRRREGRRPWRGAVELPTAVVGDPDAAAPACDGTPRRRRGRSTPFTTTGRPVRSAQPADVVGPRSAPSRRPAAVVVPGRRSSPGASPEVDGVPDDVGPGVGVLRADDRGVDGEHDRPAPAATRASSSGSASPRTAGGRPAATRAHRSRRSRRTGARVAGDHHDDARVRRRRGPSRPRRRGAPRAGASWARRRTAARWVAEQDVHRSTSRDVAQDAGRNRTARQASTASAASPSRERPGRRSPGPSAGRAARARSSRECEPARAKRLVTVVSRPRRRRSSSCRGAAPASCRRSGRPASGRARGPRPARC
jgi:hypothetical protein